MKFLILIIITTAIIFLTPKKSVISVPLVVWKIMPLGDSLTEGNYPGGINSYRGYLRAKLITNGYTNIDFVGDRSKQAHGDTTPLDLNHGGHGGYTIGPDTQRFCPTCETTGLYEHIDRWLAVSNPDIILLLVGMNDLVASQNHPVNYAQTAPDRLEKLVQKIHQLRPNAKILLSSLLKTKISTEGWQKYDAINNRAKNIGNASFADNIYFIDLHAIDFTESDYFDNVHLKGSGARKVADGWYRALIPFLGGAATPTPAITSSPTPTITMAPTNTPTPLTLTCTGGCYSSETNCRANCSVSCTRLRQSNITQSGCWVGAYRCCY